MTLENAGHAPAAKVTAVLVKHCQTVLTERRRHITKYEVANTSGTSGPAAV